MNTLPEGYHQRAASAEDAASVAGLIGATEAALSGAASTTTAQVENDWIGYDLAGSTVSVFGPNGGLAAYADIFNRSDRIINVYGYVHPDHRGRGLGTWLVGWGEDWMRRRLKTLPAQQRAFVQHYARDIDQAYRQHVEAVGYAEVRRVYVMERELPSEPIEQPSTDGYRIRPYLPGEDDPAAFLAYEAGAADMWDRPASTLEAWLETSKRSDPGLILLAEQSGSGEIGGVCMCTLTDDDGWVSGLAVVREHRRKGIGGALLARSLEEFRSRGARKAGLSVDSESPTGAGRIYERAGLRVTETYVVYRKEVRLEASAG